MCMLFAGESRRLAAFDGAGANSGWKVQPSEPAREWAVTTIEYMRTCLLVQKSPFAVHAAAPAASVPSSSTATEALKAQVVAEEAKYVLQTYARPEELVITHGEGSYVYDISGKKYLDFAAGIAVNALGHSHPQWVAAVQDQAAKLMHTSNLFHTMPQVRHVKHLPGCHLFATNTTYLDREKRRHVYSVSDFAKCVTTVHLVRFCSCKRKHAFAGGASQEAG